MVASLVPTPNHVVFALPGVSDIPIFLTLILLEGALSFDNAAVLAALTRKLPPAERRRALLYGLAGAYVFRVLAILFVTVIIANPWLKILGGGYLVFLGVRHLWPKSKPKEGGVDGLVAEPRRFLGLSAFWSTVIAVELADIAFALDQVVAAVALSENTIVIIAASIVAILLLRVSAFYVSRLMDWFPALETLAYVAVGFVGVKLLLDELAGFEIPKLLAAGITVSILTVPVLIKLALDWSKKRKAAA